MKRGKLIIFSAPSGSGKSTIINYLLGCNLDLAFSISATSRAPRGNEQNGVEYFFLTPDEFRAKIANDEFIEYEEVYKDNFYGTLKSEVERIRENGMNVVFDIDVVGGVNIKNIFGEEALSMFIMPPSVDELRNRLVGRNTDSAETIEKRLAKAEYEIGFADKFDKVVINDNLDSAKAEALSIIKEFIEK
ncbi:MAG: guanylate kinase [Muribaculaceae bacterium]|nr:guanylate kinase [Muribaculaceae bacterium]